MYATPRLIIEYGHEISGRDEVNSLAARASPSTVVGPSTCSCASGWAHRNTYRVSFLFSSDGIAAVCDTILYSVTNRGGSLLGHEEAEGG